MCSLLLNECYGGNRELFNCQQLWFLALGVELLSRSTHSFTPIFRNPEQHAYAPRLRPCVLMLTRHLGPIGQEG